MAECGKYCGGREPAAINLSFTPACQTSRNLLPAPRPMLQSHLIHLSITRPIGEVYDFLAEPRNYLKWAAVVGDRFEPMGPLEFGIETEFGPRIVRFTPRNDLGVLDHAVYREGDTPLMMPMRLIANGDGCELAFTFFRRPGMSDAAFQSAIDWIQVDLMGLKGLLEI